MIKMVVTDIDGTILAKDMELSNQTKRAFKELKKRGIKTVLATGRMYASTEAIAQELEITDPVICYQGGMIKIPLKDGSILRQILLPRELTFEIINKIKKKDLHINLYANDTLYTENDNDYVKIYCKERKISYNCVKKFEELEFDGVHKLLVIDNDCNKISELITELNEKYGEKVYCTHSMPSFCEISDLRATKGEGIEYLRTKWGIEKSEIIGFGDQDNDIELLQSVGIKVALGNGTEKLKSIADVICDTVENDGFAKTINRYILGEQ